MSWGEFPDDCLVENCLVAVVGGKRKRILVALLRLRGVAKEFSTRKLSKKTANLALIRLFIG